MRATAPTTPAPVLDHRGAPLIPEFLWPWMGWILGVLVAIVAAFAALTSNEVGPFPFEQRIMDTLRHSDVPWRLWRFGLALGSPAFFAAVVIALAAWAIARRSWAGLIACATVPGAVIIVEGFLKPLVDRRDAWHDVLYYPSATAAGVAAWTTLVWLLAVPLLRRPGRRLALAVALGALTTLTALAVVASDKHLPLDAVGGVAAGMAIVLGCAALIDRVTHAHEVPDEPEPVSPG
jgi:membrane-associated phospholipid phosphatase